MKTEEFQHIAASLPRHPGIYKYYDASNELLYVGKAKNLRKRIASYFTKTLNNYKTHELVQRIAKIDFTIVDSEQDAFLLENSLIKEFQPRFNINLKDDKTYPYIVIRNEPFPRIHFTRQKIADGSEYLGPYTSVKKVRELLEFIKQTIPLRTCSLNLSESNIRKGKFKVCLEYHLGNCKGPCEALQSEEDYREGLEQIRNILKGNLAPVMQHFKKEMKEQSALLEFEKAEKTRKKIEFLENYRSRSVIVSERLGDLDVFSLEKNEESAYVNYLMVRSGTIVQTQTIRLETKLDEEQEEILQFAVKHLRETFRSDAGEIIAPAAISYPEPEVTVTVPRGGERKKLLDLSLKNVRYFIEELQQKDRLKLLDKTNQGELLQTLQHDLQLPGLPVYIECFDNSNFQGSYPVSAMICFKNGVPSKKDYRHFNIKTVEGINDFASMKEAVYRRYKRLLEENAEFPQLIVIDGGKGQLSAALEAFREVGAEGRSTIIGLAKNVEEVFFAGDQESLKLPYNSSSLRLLRRIRDEVHRFGISFHRKQRSRGTFKNELENIKGIGKNTADLLLKTFRSVATIKSRSEEELAAVIGKSKARLVRNYFAD